MDRLKSYAFVFTAGIFFVALSSLVIISLSLGFSWTNSNFKEIKAGQAKLEDKLDQVLFEVKGHSHKPPKQAKK